MRETAPTARRDGHTLTNDELGAVRSVAWSAAELEEAFRVFKQATRADAEEREERLWELLGSPERREDLALAHLPYEQHEILHWFDQRYRGYPSRLAHHHLTRFLAVQDFLTRHWSDLVSLGLAGEDPAHMTPHLLEALALVDIDSAEMESAYEPPDMDLGHVRSLAAAIRYGEVEPSCEAPGGPPSSSILTGELFGRAARELAGWLVQSSGDRKREIVRLKRLVQPSATMPDDLDQDQLYMLLWFLFETQNPEAAPETTRHFFAVFDFLRAHRERLREDALVSKEEGGDRFSNRLLQALLLLPPREGQDQPPEYDEVLRLERALASAEC